MKRVLVLYYSMYGHIESLARAVAEGAAKVDGVEVDVKRVAETMDPEAFKNAGGKTDQTAPVASPAELKDYDAIIPVCWRPPSPSPLSVHCMRSLPKPPPTWPRWGINWPLSAAACTPRPKYAAIIPRTNWPT